MRQTRTVSETLAGNRRSVPFYVNDGTGQIKVDAGKAEIIPEKIHLNQIKWIKENTVILKDQLAKNPSYDLVMAHNMMHNLEKEIVKIRLFVDMNGVLDGSAINQGGNYEVDFIFKIGI
jgi:hypothetical protein